MRSLNINSDAQSEMSAKARFRNAVHSRVPIAFVVDDTLVDKIGRETVLTVFCDGRYDDSKFHFDIVLESPLYNRQQQGQQELSQLCQCVGLWEINEASELNSKEAVLRYGIKGELIFTPHNLIFEGA